MCYLPHTENEACASYWGQNKKISGVKSMLFKLWFDFVKDEKKILMKKIQQSRKEQSKWIFIGNISHM